MKSQTDEYIEKEAAAEKKPTELYHFWISGGSNWRLTNGDVAVTFDGETYTPADISRDSSQYEADFEVNALTINVDRLLDPVVQYIALNPVDIVWVSVVRLFRDLSPEEACVIFIGHIKEVSFKGNAASVRCVSFEHFLNQPIPKFRYQKSCNYMIYDSNCGVTKASYKTTAASVTVSADGLTLTATEFGTKANGYFTRGYVEWGSYRRKIIDHDGTAVKIRYIIPDLTTGQSVDAYAGCDGQADTCNDKFSNISEFLGFPTIPDTNPATWVPNS